MIMKTKTGLAVLILLAFAIIAASAPQAGAFIYNLSYSCDAGCMEKTGITWNITVYKGMGESFQLSQVSIIEAGTEFLVGFYNDSPVMIYAKEDILFKGKLHGFAGSTEINVSPCFTTMLEPKDRIVEETFMGFERTYCEKMNYSVPVYQCLSAGACDATQACEGNRCQAINCTSKCQYASDHRCLSYECCEDSQCNTTSECSGKKCVPLNCSAGFKAGNNTCAEIACETGEAIINGECKPLGCREDETAMNHTCKPLECSIYNIPKNHSCAKIMLEVELKQVQQAMLGTDSKMGEGLTKKESREQGSIVQGGILQGLVEILLLSAILAFTTLLANKFLRGMKSKDSQKGKKIKNKNIFNNAEEGKGR